MALVRFYPNRFNDLSKEFDRAFNHFFADLDVRNDNRSESAWKPRVDITETTDEFILSVELPGVSKDGISINYENDVLKIDGERKRPEGKEDSKFLREERYYGKFSRVFNINTKIDGEKIEAAFKDGVLTIRLQKAEEVKPKEIKIKA